jgi:hypothetical protein
MNGSLIDLSKKAPSERDGGADLDGRVFGNAHQLARFLGPLGSTAVSIEPCGSSASVVSAR